MYLECDAAFEGDTLDLEDNESVCICSLYFEPNME
jgi:hypothetical protein